jgi:cytochrome c oxidase cbb3-type subunit 2
MKRMPARFWLMVLLLIPGLILIVLSSRRPLSAADLTQGKVLYDAHCAACHGINGDGNGPQAADFNPTPTNFTSATEMANVPFDVNELTVSQGKPGTGMPGFGMVLSPEEIQDVIAYERAFLQQP